MNEVQAYAAMSAKQPVEPYSFTLPDLGPNDVRIDITHCGICRSDVDYIDNRLGYSTFPAVAGHEVIGSVAEKGSAVTHLEVGQRVGVGPLRGACLRCSYCASGRDNLCPSLQLTIVGGNHGGFAKAIQLDASFAFAIPDALPSESAAPLLCAGITVYAPLRRLTQPADRVGIIGIGGLGHMALKFAAKRGNEVTALSTSPDKAVEAARLGAHRFISTRDAAAFRAAAGSLDFILSTVDADLSWNDYLSLLRPDGIICIVGASLGPIGVPAGGLIMKQNSFTGSAAGSRAATQEMLDFAGRHGITSEVEVIPISELNAALDRLRRSSPPHRLVLRV
jgi:alcohol/geraniol dehydrogenase (NADP+)